MPRRPRRNHSPAFTSKVALAALWTTPSNLDNSALLNCRCNFCERRATLKQSHRTSMCSLRYTVHPEHNIHVLCLDEPHVLCTTCRDYFCYINQVIRKKL